MPQHYKSLPRQKDELPVLVGKNFRFMHAWAEQNESEFSTVMQALAKENHSKYADIYVKVMQMLATQSRMPSHIQVNHTLGEDDKERLAELSREKETADYEEIRES